MNTKQISEITDTNGSLFIHTWQDDDGWYSCRSGEYRSNSFESDDQGPFSSEEEAFDQQMDEVKEYQ